MGEYKSLFNSTNETFMDILTKEKDAAYKYQAENAQEFCTDLLEEAKVINDQILKFR